MESKRVLVIDDSASVRQQVCLTLIEAGFEVVEAVDGLDGIEKLVGSPFSAVLCDVNMPRMNGLEMLERLHGEGRAAQVPIVMLTTEGQPSLMKRARAAGAKGWIIKPFKPTVLVATVKQMVAA